MIGLIDGTPVAQPRISVSDVVVGESDGYVDVVVGLSAPGQNVVTVNYEADGTIHARCTWPWALNGGVACTHVMAALEHLAEMRGRKLSFWSDREAAQRQQALGDLRPLRHRKSQMVEGMGGEQPPARRAVEET